MALLFLKTDKELNDRVKSAFVPLIDSSQTFVDFKLNDEIMFTPLYRFLPNLTKDEIGADSIMLKDRMTYFNKYNFDRFKIPEFKRVMHPSKSQLILTFSKPIGNFLLGEFFYSKYETISKYKRGKAIAVAFFFDDRGYIYKVLDTEIDYF